MVFEHKNLSLSLPVIFLVASIFLGGAIGAHAVTYTQLQLQPANDFIIEPAKIEVFGNPGDVIDRQISVTSRIPGTTDFRLELEDFIGTDETKFGPGEAVSPVKLLAGDTSPYSLKKGIIPEVQDFKLKMGQKVTVPVQIKIPENAAPGGFYTALIASNAPSKEALAANNSGTRAISRAGALLFVRVNGEAKESGEVEDFSITPTKWIYSPGNVDFQVLFSNTGNVHLAPYGTIEVKNFFGTSIGSVPIDAYYSLPLSKRYRTLSYGTTELFGRYTATLNLNKSFHNPSAGNSVETKEISFWVIPFKLLIGIFFGVLFLVLLSVYVLKNFDIRKKK